MRFSFWRSVQLGAAYTGAVVGAGFASGQEIVQFFLVFGAGGIKGLALLGILFAVFGISVLILIEANGVETYQDMMHLLFGKKIGFLFDIWVTLFLMTGLCVMLAGGAAVFMEHLHLPGALGLAATAGGVAVGLIGQKKGVLGINSLLIPFMVAAALSVGAAALFFGETSLSAPYVSPQSAGILVGSNWLMAAILYVSYNMVIGLVILSSLGKKVVEGNWLGGAMGGLFIGTVALIMGLALLRFSSTVFIYEIPMVYIAGKVHPALKLVYICFLWLALLTTAIANAYGLTKSVASLTGWNGQIVGLVLLAAVLPFTPIGFTKLVANLYPLFGYAGLPVLAAIVYHTLKTVHKGR